MTNFDVFLDAWLRHAVQWKIDMKVWEAIAGVPVGPYVQNPNLRGIRTGGGGRYLETQAEPFTVPSLDWLNDEGS